MFSVADLVTALGWFGAVAGAVAYLLVSRGRWTAASARYQSANLTGAGLMGGVAAFNGVWPSVAANLIWVVIGAQALCVITLKKRSSGTTSLDAEPIVAEAVEAAVVDLDTRTVTVESEAPVVEEVWEERDPTLRMSTAELAALTKGGLADRTLAAVA